MSYNIGLGNPSKKNPFFLEGCQVGAHNEGAIQASGGNSNAEMSVTYNYAPFFDFRGLSGKTAEETIPELEKAVARLGTIQDPNYWAATPGNVGHTCSILLGWARLHPQAIWIVQ